MSNKLTIQQQVWLAAWSAAIQSGKYNPKDEAKACLVAFEEQFSLKPSTRIKMLDDSDIKEAVIDK